MTTINAKASHPDNLLFSSVIALSLLFCEVFLAKYQSFICKLQVHLLKLMLVN